MLQSSRSNSPKCTDRINISWIRIFSCIWIPSTTGSTKCYNSHSVDRLGTIQMFSLFNLQMNFKKIVSLLTYGYRKMMDSALPQCKVLFKVSLVLEITVFPIYLDRISRHRWSLSPTSTQKTIC